MNGASARVIRRSAARLAAVQALYEIDMVGAPATPVLQEFLSRRWSDATPIDKDDPAAAEAAEAGPKLPSPEQRFLKKLVNGVSDDTEALDRELVPYLNAPRAVEQLDTLVRAILRAGAFEIRHCPEVAPATIISEYVGLSHAFFSENEPAMIHAVLDRLAQKFRGGEAAGSAAGSS